MSGPSNNEKHLDKFFKICHTGFWQLDLATCSWLILVAKNAYFAYWGYFQDSFQKLFIFLSHIVTVHCLVCPFLFQTHRVHSQNLHFSSSFLYQSSRICMGSFFFSKYFMFLALNFLDFVFLFGFGLWIFCWVWCLGFIGFGSMMPTIHVFMFASHFWVVYPICVMHIIPIVKCLMDIFLCYCGFHGIQCL